MKILPILAVPVLAALCQSPAMAHNNHFLPGDSFFSVSVTRKVIDQWTENKGKNFGFEYSRFDGKFMVDGNLGYTKLKMDGIDSGFQAALTKAYWRYTALERPLFRLESDDQEVYTQTNGVVALIYHKDFQGPLGLKLNENWQIEGLRKYSGLFEKAEPVITDWTLGPEHLPLQLKQPVPPLAHIPLENEERLTMDTPVTVDASEIKVIFVGFAKQDGFEEAQTCPNLQNIYDNVPGTKYIVIDGKGFTTWTCDDSGKWSQARTQVK
ncbi:MAG: hypothetical protein P1V20_07105 [Verrucomicrobiales bacterium]|nr:hypothetical protein [Verrucomicrobiales bacterium]